MVLFIIVLFLVIFMIGCRDIYNTYINHPPYYIVGSDNDKKELIQLSNAMEEQSDSPEANFILIQEIAKILVEGIRQVNV